MQMQEILIDVKNLVKQYGKQKAVNDVSFQIRKGMICGLVGPNGAGKTTIFRQFQMLNLTGFAGNFTV